MKTAQKETQILTHIATGVQFEFIRVVKPQFSNFKYVVLLNLKSGKEERFNNSTYLNYFTK